MKEENKEVILFGFIFTATVMGIGGAYGLALSCVDGIEKAVISIPFWVVAGFCYLMTYLLKVYWLKPLN